MGHRTPGRIATPSRAEAVVSSGALWLISVIFAAPA
jgi:hypothetical protein